MKALFPVPVSIELAIRRILASLPLALLGPLAQGQNIDQPMSTNNPPPAPVVSRTQQALVRDAISTTWEVLEQTFYPATGIVASRTNRYVELGDGLNYLSDPSTGQWAPSEDLIQLMADGSAAALKGPTKLYLKPNLNSPGAVRIVSGNGGVFQTRPIGLFWYDPVSGNASLIAQAQDCAGELEPPNQVVYRGAFGEVGDLRLSYTKGAVESDLVLLECPALPAGFDPATARLELWHACQPTTAPKITPHQVGAQGTTDDVLDFGGLWFPTGAAYWSDGSGARAANSPATVRVPTLTDAGTLAPVCKTWLPGSTQDVLVEAVAWKWVAAKLGSLPPTAPTYVPAPAQDRSSWLAELEATGGPSSTPPGIIHQGAGYHPVGLVCDYVVNGSYGDYTFASDQTYYVNPSASFSGNVTFNPCVIKFSSGAYILAYGSITCNGSSSAPTIFTSSQDGLFGADVETYQPCPTQEAAEALWAYYINANVSVSGLRFRWANTALRFDGGGSGCTNAESVSNCSFEFCGVGICGNFCTTTVSSSTKYSVATPTQVLGECASFMGALADIPNTLDLHMAAEARGRACNTLTDFNNASQAWFNNPPEWNGDCWLAGVNGLSATCIGHWTADPGPLQPGQYPIIFGYPVVTMVSPIHFLFAQHTHPENYPVLAFLDPNGYVRYATMVDRIDATPGSDTDIAVGILDTNLSSYAGYLPVLDPNYSTYLPTGNQNYVQGIGAKTDPPWNCARVFSQPMGLFRNSVGNMCDWGSNKEIIPIGFGLGPGWSMDLQGEDSSAPQRFLINNQLVLVSAAYHSTDGPNYAYFINEINQAMSDLSARHPPAPSYTLTVYPLTGWPPIQ